jgi:multiple sugar transport system permease protein/raffinose/stachyose/melibiose transport system permease protein
VPYISGGQVFGMFLLRSFFASQPEEMFEAARIDGASDFVMLTRLAIPLSVGILGTLAILNILSSWNDLVWPSIVLPDDSVKTLTIGLWSFMNSQYAAANWGPLLAGYAIASVPLVVLFAFTSRLFIKGLSSGAIKM